ncbi:MAG TPA: hypothetical protein VE643_07720 [Nitrososphaeraceae archaeon]|nr:hypothetical protein [Nitrososphaeraceae archaeon]
MIEKRAIKKTILCIVLNPFGVFREMLRRKPNKNPDTVVKRALSLITAS